jgi:phage FluMu protein Com
MVGTYVFSCPHCGQGLEADPAQAGLLAECPRCREVLTVPAPGAVPAPPARTRTAPLPPAEPAPLNATVRIDLPNDIGVPAPPRRTLVIRRRRPA